MNCTGLTSHRQNFIHLQWKMKENIKHLFVFLATNIIFIGQLEKDIGDA